MSTRLRPRLNVDTFDAGNCAVGAGVVALRKGAGAWSMRYLKVADNVWRADSGYSISGDLMTDNVSKGSWQVSVSDVDREFAAWAGYLEGCAHGEELRTYQQNAEEPTERCYKKCAASVWLERVRGVTTREVSTKELCITCTKPGLVVEGASQGIPRSATKQHRELSNYEKAFLANCYNID